MLPTVAKFGGRVFFFRISTVPFIGQLNNVSENSLQTVKYYAILTFYEASLWKWLCTQAQWLEPFPLSGVS
jgi:hypothetical protein